ncbi:MAG: hypothetical protein WCI74_07295, partial [Actinomycetes bacterium]
MSEATGSSGADSIDSGAIRNALEREDYDTVIVEVRAAMAADPVAALADPVINDWLGRRFRNIFIDEAMDDPEAVKAGEAMFPLNLIDQRDQRQKVAERMIRNIDPDEVHVEMPKPVTGTLTNTTFVFAPGLLTGLLPSLAFQSVWPIMKERFGVRIIAADAHPVRPAEKNVADLENTIERGIGVDSDPEGSFITAEDNPTPPGDVLLMGYSKGSPDILSLLVARPDLAPRIKGVIGWAGAVGGSYAADDIYETIKDMPLFGEAAELSGVVTKQLLRLAPITQLSHVDRRIEEYDARGAIKTLTTWYRSKFLEDNKG